MPPSMALIVILRGSDYRSLEQMFMVPKGFEPSKFDCMKILFFPEYKVLHYMKYQSLLGKKISIHDLLNLLRES